MEEGHNPPPPLDFVSPIDDIRIAHKFIDCLRGVSLGNTDKATPIKLSHRRFSNNSTIHPRLL
jgi:hypothetical protein